MPHQMFLDRIKIISSPWTDDTNDDANNIYWAYIVYAVTKKLN